MKMVINMTMLLTCVNCDRYIIDMILIYFIKINVFLTTFILILNGELLQKHYYYGVSHAYI